MKNLLVIIGVLSVMLFTGCLHNDISQIPLTEGEIPYALPAGTYTDSKGILHIETNQRWSVSEADFFRMILAYTKDNPTNPPVSK